LAITFLLTADWQIGMRPRFLDERSAEYHRIRLDAAQRAIAYAKVRRVDFVLLAGDTFDHPLVPDALIEEVVQILAAAELPVYVLPGNHDPLRPGEVWDRAEWRNAPPNVHLCRTTDEIELPGGAVLCPCPLTQKRSAEDPTQSIRRRTPGDERIRIGLAHGSLDRLGGKENFPIASDRVERAGLDFLALGDWHGLTIQGRTAFPGTHETTSFADREPGNVLFVTLESGAEPQIDVSPVGRLRWHSLNRHLADLTDVEALEAEIQALGPIPDLVLHVKPSLGSGLTSEGRARLKAIKERLAPAYHLQWDQDDEVPADVEMPAGLLMDVAATLFDAGEEDALALLRRLVAKEQAR